MKILLIDPDPRVRKSLERTLKDEYIIDTAMSAKSGEDMLYSTHYDLLLMDLVLPDMDGEQFIPLVRANLRDFPIIVISNRFGVSDKNFAFDSGADDYIVKPLNTIELKARIKAVLRRKHPLAANLLHNIKVRDLLLDRAKRMVFYKDKRLMLRKKEMQLLEFLLINKNKIVTRLEILEHVWDATTSPFTNTVEVHLKRVRDKIEKPYNEKYIETIHGFGYVIEEKPGYLQSNDE